MEELEFVEGTAQFSCTQCQNGYSFEDGECKETAHDGCYIKNFENEEECKMCHSGYSMSNIFKCVSNVLEQTEEEKTEEQTESKSKMLSLLLWMYFCILSY